ncbi:MAG: glutaminase [Gemmatimonadaceae bacterium]|nr:glutaminase [Gemmatimonadaceae bacterium]
MRRVSLHQSAANIQAAVDSAYARVRGVSDGKNASYIPALAAVDPDLFGIAVVTADGRTYTAGDVRTEVSIQSISKVFTMAAVMQALGPDSVVSRIGVDATGMRFNSIVAIEIQEQGSKINPLVASILGMHEAFAGRKLRVLDDIYQSERASNQRNRAIAALMAAYGRIVTDPERATDIYTRQCSIGVNAVDLASMAGTLAAGGRNPRTGARALDARLVPRVLAVMATAGLYDDSGQWLYETGLPAKSGVGGGIIAVSPGRFGIAVISPPLDEAGNSVRAQRAIAMISEALGGNPYLARVP